ncbi:flagellar basal body P-ring formation chaperone FlgA [Pinirhizobacter sp.]|jgi:flagella basal body P-ring formation protein FlgA|uniref:flagellar basal body P-ring formation chaperone FlgA n=1 Tax=Pinirhizobacter sp. TaxID=2950432 RepID=UPI002F41E7F7
MISTAGVAIAADAGPNEAVTVARAAVQTRLGPAYHDVHLDVTAAPIHAGVPGTTYHAMPIQGKFPRARLTVMVQVCAPNHGCKAQAVGFALTAHAETLVYTDSAASHTPGSLLVIEPGTVDVVAMHGAPLASRDAVRDMRLRRAVRAGGAASLEDFEPVPDVDDRQRVTLVAEAGAITIESSGTAMRSGNRGDQVPVQVAGATEPVRGVVTGRGVVHVAR